MRVLISGAGGMVGTALAAHWSGHDVFRLVRRPVASPNEIFWNPQDRVLDSKAIEGFDAFVHLAGASIAAGRWSGQRKREIRDSRVESTRLLASSITQLTQPPKTWLSASATGYYGDRGDEILTERSGPGSGFLASVCQEWEAATAPAVQAGVRVVCCRLGMVLSGTGGALPTMALPFRFGLGGRLGSGRQYVSWICLDDLVRAFHHLINEAGIAGPVNVVSPNPVRNLDFVRSLSRVLGRPAIFPAPAAALRLMLGEMAQELLLSGARVQPERLLSSGYRFSYPELTPALRHVLHERVSATGAA
jgi:uncharacterized protein (TIGR01777 family)